METTHKRRVRYKGTHPRNYQEKYKELQPEKYADTIEKVIRKGSTPAGMHISMAKRIVKMMKKSEKNGDILMTGGGALNVGIRKAFEEELMKDVYVASYPQINGAIGAALIASERA